MNAVDAAIVGIMIFDFLDLQVSDGMSFSLNCLARCAACCHLPAM